MSDGPKRYRKKPVVIEAMGPLTDDNAQEVATWCGGRVTRVGKRSDPTDVRVEIDIPTLEGVMTASPGDWIIRGVAGEFYPCKDTIFTATYDEVHPIDSEHILRLGPNSWSMQHPQECRDQGLLLDGCPYVEAVEGMSRDWLASVAGDGNADGDYAVRLDVDGMLARLERLP